MFSGEQHGKAEEAIRFYTSLFKNSAITFLDRYGEGEHGPEGTVKFANFSLDGQEYMAIDSVEDHAFGFTPSISIFVRCESEDEIDTLHEALIAGGRALMPLGDYGFSKKFAWIADRYGITWQLNLE
jgi:predicted 3-demethylubiquinone-9 3-methyltransferase (glyoxalase superfamily)